MHNSDRWVVAGRDAARHIFDAGYLPMLDTDVLDALLLRGDADRVFTAQELYELAGES